MVDILVLMSTYNGEKFISEQLDSIFAQQDVNVRLIIRDDGSKDNTPAIVRKYMNSNPGRIVFIPGENIGWKKSYFTLIAHAAEKYRDIQYFAFSDQDDIWLPEKLSSGIEMISQDKDIPALYCSNLSFYRNGEDLGVIRKKPVNAPVKTVLLRNYATGCTIIFNRRLLTLIAENLPHIDIAHDYWFYIVASMCGKVVIDDRSFILYRQHDNNQIGTKRGWREIWRRRLKSISTLIGDHDKEKLCNELLRLHKDSMREEAVTAVEKLGGYRKTISSRISLLSDKGYTYNKTDSDFWLKVRIICGRV